MKDLKNLLAAPLTSAPYAHCFDCMVITEDVDNDATSDIFYQLLSSLIWTMVIGQ